MAANFKEIKPISQNEIKICCITLNMSDTIRLISLPIELIPVIRRAIQDAWGNIQREDDHHGAYEFKLQGNPWWGDGQDAVTARELLTSIFHAMAKQGWKLITSCDVSKKSGDKDTLFFENETPDPSPDIFCVSFNMGDRIRVIGAQQMMPSVRQAVTTHWLKGIQDERLYHGVPEIKMSGNPWWPDSSDAVYSRMMLAQIIANFKAAGYKLYGSVDVSVGGAGHDLDTWYFRKMNSYWS